MYKIEDLSIPTNSEELDLITLEGEDFLPVVENDFNITSYLNSGLSDDTEATLDVATVVVPGKFIPISPRGPPERKIESKCNFAVEIDGSMTQKTKFLYSHDLNRIFVMMASNFSVNFEWDERKVPQRAMFIRATVVFSHPEQAEKRVERCLQHAHVTSNAQTTDAVVINNVLRSARAFGDPNVYYCGSPQETDCWYSVVVRLDGPTGHAYHFVCKNSCSSGINRRAIDIIFTLEDSLGTVYGRQIVGARVCSSPRRDKKQQEAELLAGGGKRALPSHRRTAPTPTPDHPLTKKIKLEVVPDPDTKVVTVPEMDIARAAITSLKATQTSLKAAQTSLKVAHSMMDQLRASNRRSTSIEVEDLDRRINNINKTIQDLESEYNIKTGHPNEGTGHSS